MPIADDYFQSPDGNWKLKDSVKPANVKQPARYGALGALGDLGNALPVLVNLADINPSEVEWIWQGWIPLGFVSLMTGDPGAGKTYCLLSLVSIIAEGGVFPDGNTCTPGRVLYLDGENGPEEVRRRLDAQGVTMWNSLRLLSEVQTSGKCTPLSLDYHFDSLVTAIDAFKPHWVIVDPLVAFHQRNEISAVEVRHLLLQLADIARKFNIAITVVQHPNKNFKAPELYRVRGSLDFVAAVRAVLNVTILEDDTRALAMEKLNLAVKPQPVGFRIADRKVEWIGRVTLPSSRSEEKRVAEFLKAWLADGPVPAKDIYKAAEAEEIAKRTLQRVKSSMGIRSRKRGSTGPWEWVLPTQERQKSAANEAKVANIAKDASKDFKEVWENGNPPF